MITKPLTPAERLARIAQHRPMIAASLARELVANHGVAADVAERAARSVVDDLREVWFGPTGSLELDGSEHARKLLSMQSEVRSAIAQTKREAERIEREQSGAPMLPREQIAGLFRDGWHQDIAPPIVAPPNGHQRSAQTWQERERTISDGREALHAQLCAELRSHGVAVDNGTIGFTVARHAAQGAAERLFADDGSVDAEAFAALLAQTSRHPEIARTIQMGTPERDTAAEQLAHRDEIGALFAKGFEDDLRNASAPTASKLAPPPANVPAHERSIAELMNAGADELRDAR